MTLSTTRGIAFDDVGVGAATVVLIHGAFADRSYFAPQIEELRQRHRVIALDLRGHGESGVNDGSFTMRDLADDVIAVCEVAAVDRAVFCGHSMPVALEVATLRPDLAAGVVLLDGVVLFPDVIRKQALSTLIPALEGEAWRQALQDYVSRFFGPYDSPALKSRVMQDVAKTPRGIAAPLLRDIMSSDFSAQLAAGEYPLLFIHARVPADLARLRQLRSDALIGSVVGSGHYLTLEVPDQVNAMLDRFLSIAVRRS